MDTPEDTSEENTQKYVTPNFVKIIALFKAYGLTWSSDGRVKKPEMASEKIQKTLSTKEALANARNPSARETGCCHKNILTDKDGVGIVQLFYIPHLNHTANVNEPATKKQCIPTPSFPACQSYAERLMNHPDPTVRDLFSARVDAIHGTTGEPPPTDTYANHRALGEYDICWRVKVIALPKAMHDAIDNEDIVNLILNCPSPYWHVSELLEIVCNAKATGSQKNLTFMRGAWSVMTGITPQPVTSGKCIVLDGNHLPEGASPIPGFQTVIRCSENQPVVAYALKGIASEYNKSAKPIAKEDEIAILANQGSPVESVEYWCTRLKKKLEDIPEPVLRESLRILAEEHKSSGMSEFASMLQKLIRYRSKFIRCMPHCKTTIDPFTYHEKIPAAAYEGSVLIDTRIALIFCMHRILIHPGQFVPNIQRFVRGPEKLAKRLAVIAVEDSDPTHPDMANMLVTLLSAALLSQRVPHWFPTKRVVHGWMKTGLRLWESSTAIHYSPATPHPITTANATTPLQLCAAILRVVGSFPGDMNMLDDVALSAAEQSIRRCRQSDREMPPMPWFHKDDQHTHPNIALLLAALGNPVTGPSATPYGPILNQLFTQVTGRNPRRDDTAPYMEEDATVKQARVAQIRLNLLKKGPSSETTENHPMVVGTRTITIPEEQVRQWFAAMLGVLPVGGIQGVNGGRNIPMVVTLDPNDPTHHLIPTIKPAVRGQTPDKADQALSDPMVLKTSVQKGWEMLRKGTPRLNAIPFNSLPQVLRRFHNRRVKWVTLEGQPGKGTDSEEPGCYMVQMGTPSKPNWTPWSTLTSQLTTTISLLDHPVALMSGPVLGETHDAEARIRALCANTSMPVLQRVLYYITHYRGHFRMNSVSRDGGTLKGSYNHSVSEYDGDAFQWLLDASRIVPNALRYCNRPSFSFRVADVFALYRWRQVMKDVMQQRRLGSVPSLVVPSSASSVSSTSSGWPVLHDRLNRTLMDYQRAAVQRMLGNRQSGGQTAHFLNVRVGLGKTLIFLTYLQQRGLTDMTHIIYTMPRSAFSGVLRELVEMGLSVDIVTGATGKSHSASSEYTKIGNRQEATTDKIRAIRKVTDAKPFRVIVIEHDTLRKAKADLLKIAPQSVLVIDEVHKCMYSGTQRTGATLELVRAAGETVAMTGTPVLNAGSGKLLIPYLEMVVPFFIGPQNFLVASNAMVAYRVETGVGRKETLVDPWADHPAARQLHDAALASQQQDALSKAVELCYGACTPQMIRETLSRLSEGVLLVARNRAHQAELAHLLMKTSAELRVFVMASNDEGLPSGVTYGNDIHLTTKTVEESTEESFQVVLVRQDQCEGYTVTALGAMVTSVYFSNQATREQMRGRIDRLTQHRLASKGLFVEYVTVQCGILKNISANYAKAGLLSQAMSGKRLNAKDMQQLLELGKE